MIDKAMRPSSLRCTSLALILIVAFGTFGAGCGTYGYAARGPGFSTLPIDRMTPQESDRWSFFWGMISSVWTPVECIQFDATGSCTQKRDPCDGHGAGEVHLSLAWYTVPMAVLTLGMAIPSKISVYCSTFAPLECGP
jgi:hypothetical protein